MCYEPSEAKSRHCFTKDGECGGIEVGSRKDGWWFPSVTDDLRVVEGRDGVRDQVGAVTKKVRGTVRLT